MKLVVSIRQQASDQRTQNVAEPPEGKLTGYTQIHFSRFDSKQDINWLVEAGRGGGVGSGGGRGEFGGLRCWFGLKVSPCVHSKAAPRKKNKKPAAVRGQQASSSSSAHRKLPVRQRRASTPSQGRPPPRHSHTPTAPRHTLLTALNTSWRTMNAHTRRWGSAESSSDARFHLLISRFCTRN